jgi:hypothetical protein
MLQKANLIAELYGYATEYALSRALQFATPKHLPLDEKKETAMAKSG